MKNRAVSLFLHRYLGLMAGVLFILVGISGSFLVGNVVDLLGHLKLRLQIHID